MTHRGTPTFEALPLVGRTAELSLLGDWLSDVANGYGSVHLIAGQSGIGKTRLAKALGERAERDGWMVTTGRVYAVESGVPYAVWSDAFVQLLRGIDPAVRTVMTRGGDWLGTICPPFAKEMGSAPHDDSRDGKARLLWNCAQFLMKMAEKQPLLLVLENLHVADTASLELLHFVARQIGAARSRIGILGTYNEAELDRNATLRDTEQSLLALGGARLVRLNPLTQTDVESLVCEAFAVDHSAARQLARRLYAWTRGLPFFVEETLKSLVESGRLYERGGAWLGWEVEELGVPRSVHAAISKRLEHLSADARAVAGVASVIGARLRFRLLRDVCELPENVVLTALDELCRLGILVEAARTDEGDYEFAHAMIQDVVYEALGVARARLLHARVARALEAFFGGEALVHADVLAFHFAKSDPDSDAGKTALYLAAAGRDALARHADRAAADYLSAALERHPLEIDTESLVDDLAQARQRLGEYDAALSLWQRARAEAESRGNLARVARIARRMGLACFWSGRFDEAIAHFDAALAAATRSGAHGERAQTQLSRATVSQSLGRPADAERDLGDALETAEQLGDRSLLGRTHRSLLFLKAFVGPPEQSRAHGERALAIAEELEDRSLMWSAHWGLATLAGLTGDGAGAMQHVHVCDTLADELQSPLLRGYSGEIAMHHAFASGNWDEGIALTEQIIATARAANQRTLLPRLLAGAAQFYTARGEWERAKLYLDESWEVGVARAARGRPIEVHSQVAVYAGLAAFYLASGEFARAVEIGEQGLEIADRAGYAVWSAYRLIPVTAEAALWSKDGARARKLRDRLLEESTQLGNRLGLVWVGAGDGLIARLNDDFENAERLIRKSIVELEEVPWVYDAARLRRWLADVLIRMGDQEAGVRELRKSHEICARLGARVELERAREMMKQLGLRLPAREAPGGKRLARLTDRESDIARLVAERKSNKEIARSLGISARTVTTHVANIFTKLGVTSRGELADRVRDGTVAGAGPS